MPEKQQIIEIHMVLQYFLESRHIEISFGFWIDLNANLAEL